MSTSNRMSVRRVLAAAEPGADLTSLETADRFARALGAPLVLMQVLPAAPEPDASLDGAFAPIPEGELLRELAREVQRCTGREQGILELILARGDPVDRIVEQARDHEQLVVVGTHARRGMQRLMLGSVATGVLRGAGCSVLVARASSPSAGPILAACDLAATSQSVIEVAGALGRRFDARVVALHTMQVNMGDAAVVATALFSGAVPSQPDAGTVDAMTQAATGALRADLCAAGTEADAEAVAGAPVVTILDRARALGASLIVVGTHGRRGVSRLILGSVAEGVVRGAPCNVLVVR